MNSRARLIALTVAASLAASPTIGAQVTSRARLAGTIVDQLGKPVGGADVTLKRGDQSSRTASNVSGEFDFGAVATGPAVLSFRRLGFRDRVMNVDVGSVTMPASLEVDMMSVASELEPVVVAETSVRLQEFNEHRKQSKFGHFLDQDQIHNKNPRYVSELFRGIPGARLAPSPQGGSILRLRGCQPKVWLDGVVAQYAEIDDVIAPSEIAGIEIYPSMAGVPARYMDRENRACGVVLIWTRQS